MRVSLLVAVPWIWRSLPLPRIPRHPHIERDRALRPHGPILPGGNPQEAGRVSALSLTPRTVEVNPLVAPVEPATVRTAPGRSLVIGHRGSPRLHPENSWDGFQAALAAGADGIEFDVRVAADGVPVICHDPDLWRTHQEKVHLKSLPAHSLPVPTLESVLRRLAETNPTCTLDIELKEPLAPHVLGEILDRAGWTGKTVVTSFISDTVRRHAEHGEWPVGLLIDDRRLGVRDARALVHLTNANLLAVRNPVFLGSIREALREDGAGLWVWTLNRRAQIQKAARLGADAIVTDLPGLACSVLRPDARGPTPGV